MKQHQVKLIRQNALLRYVHQGMPRAQHRDKGTKSSNPCWTIA